MRDLQPRIELSPKIVKLAPVPLERMLARARRTGGQGAVGSPQVGND